MSYEELGERKTRRTSPARTLRIKLREELQPFYRDMSTWNDELASLTEQVRHSPNERAKQLAAFSRLRRAIELGRNHALRGAEKLAGGSHESIIEDADRASALLLKRIEEAMR